MVASLQGRIDHSTRSAVKEEFMQLLLIPLGLLIFAPIVFLWLISLALLSVGFRVLPERRASHGLTRPVDH